MRSLEAEPLAYLSILVYFIGLSLFASQAYPLGQVGSPDNDFYGWYAPDTRKILQGEIREIQHYAYKGIGYDLLLACIGLFQDDLFRAGVIVSNLSSLLALIAIYRFFSSTFGPIVGWVTLLGTMANPAFMTYGYSVCPDMAFTAFVFLSLALLTIRGPSSRVLLALSGGVAGYAYVIKYNALFLFLPLGYLFLTHKAPRARLVSVYLLSFGLVVLPWHLLLYDLTGNPFYHRQYINLAYDLLYEGRVGRDYFFEYLEPQYHSTWQVISSDPTGFFVGLLKNLRGHLLSQLDLLIHPSLKPLILLGLVLLLGRRSFWKDPRQVFWLGCGVSYYLLMSLIHYEDRYSLFLVPFYISLGFFPFLGPFWQGLKSRAIPGVRMGLSLLLLVFLFHQGIKGNLERVSRLPTEILSFAEYLRFFAQEKEILMARAPQLAYCAGLEYWMMPLAETIPGLVEYAQKRGVRYLYFSELEARYRPWLGDLLVPRSHHPALWPLMVWQSSGKRAVLYALGPARRPSLPERPPLPFRAHRGSLPTRLAPWSPGRPYTLQGLLRISQAGRYRLAFSGERYRIEVDGKVLLSRHADSGSSYQRQPIDLSPGFHFLQVRVQHSPGGILPLGLFWETPSGKRGPIPKESLLSLSLQPSAMDSR